MKTITIEIKSVYGNELIYPVCDEAKLFSKLTGKKTFGNSDINTIKALGYVINVKQAALTL